MPYYKVLRNAIVSSGYSSSEIIKKCNEDLGVHLNKSHLSKLLNNKANPPREELSKAIAKICDIDERKLLFEGYIDNAPKEIQEIFKNMQYMLSSSAINFAAEVSVEDILTEEEILEYNIDKNLNILELIKPLLENEPLSDMLIQLLDDQTENIDFVKNGFSSTINDSKISIELKNPVGFTVNDNSMKPLLETNDKVTIEIKKQYNNSDMVVYFEKKDKNKSIKIRNLTVINNNYVLSPINKEYKEEIYKKSDISIIGRVNNIIKKI